METNKKCVYIYGMDYWLTKQDESHGIFNKHYNLTFIEMTVAFDLLNMFRLARTS